MVIKKIQFEPIQRHLHHLKQKEKERNNLTLKHIIHYQQA
jgi:hypothetical protein